MTLRWSNNTLQCAERVFVVKLYCQKLLRIFISYPETGSIVDGVTICLDFVSASDFSEEIDAYNQLPKNIRIRRYSEKVCLQINKKILSSFLLII